MGVTRICECIFRSLPTQPASDQPFDTHPAYHAGPGFIPGCSFRNVGPTPLRAASTGGSFGRSADGGRPPCAAFTEQISHSRPPTLFSRGRYRPGKMGVESTKRPGWKRQEPGQCRRLREYLPGRLDEATGGGYNPCVRTGRRQDWTKDCGSQRAFAPEKEKLGGACLVGNAPFGHGKEFTHK